VAFHLACESLRAGEASAALACGVNLILAPDPFIGMSAFNFLSPDGLSYSFDHRASGYSRGEGFAAVLLKPLDAALRDHDTIRAIVRSSAVAQDGRTPGITLPSRSAQASLIRHTYARAGLDFDQTAFFEAHGTGTVAGDAAELGAIGDVFAASRTSSQKLLVGSAKTNIGHLEGCAGLAGIIKAVLTVERGKVPPNLNFEKPRPENDLEVYNIKIPTELTSWPKHGLRRASVNCFGFGGTIAHLVIDEPGVARDLVNKSGHPIIEGSSFADKNRQDAHQSNGTHLSRKRNNTAMPSPESETEPPAMKRIKTDDEIISLLEVWPGACSTRPQLFVWSAPEQDAVRRNAQATGACVDTKRTEDFSDSMLHDVAHTLDARRSRFSWRSFVVARTEREFVHNISDQLSRAVQSSEFCNVCFVFTGQGAQWAQMGLSLLAYPVFSKCLHGAEDYLKSLGSSWSVLEELKKDPKASRIDEPEKSQTICTIIQTALVDLLDSWNVRPTAIVGHSSGEIAAAYAAGALSRQDAWRLAHYRGKACTSAPPGAMLAVALSSEDAQKYIKASDVGDMISVACLNSPTNVTISGDVGAIEAIQATMNQAQVFNRKLKVGVAYHSPYMQAAGQQYLSAIEGIEVVCENFTCPIYSSVTGRELHASELDASYFVRNLQSPVRFDSALSAACEASRPAFILEVGPHAVLQSVIRETLSQSAFGMPSYSSLLVRQKDSAITTLEAIGSLWAHGCPLDIARVNDPEDKRNGTCLSNLPPYVWNHSRPYWFESDRSRAQRQRKNLRLDILGTPDVGSNNINMVWRNFLSPRRLPWLRDHKVQGVILFPAAGMISMVLEAAREVVTDATSVRGFELHDLQINRAMVIPDTGPGLETSLHVSPSVGGDGYDCSISSRTGEGPWQRNFTGSLTICYTNNHDATPCKYISNDALEANMSPKKLYQKLNSLGMSWGPTFQNLVAGWQTTSGCSFEVKIPDTKAVMPANYETPHLIHPATFDAFFHATVFASLTNGAPKVPKAIEYIYISNHLPNASEDVFRGTTTFPAQGIESSTAGICINTTGCEEPVVIIEGLSSAAIGSDEDVDDAVDQAMCTRALWKEDIDLLGAEPLGRLSTVSIVDLMAHKNPNLNIIELVEDESIAFTPKLLEILAPDSSKPRFGRYTYAYPRGGTYEQTKKDLLDRAALLEFRDFDVNKSLEHQSLTMAVYDCVLVPGSSVSAGSEYLPLLKPGGRLFVGHDLIQASPMPKHTTQSELVLVHSVQESSFDSLLTEVYKQLSSTFSVNLMTVDQATAAGTTDKFVLMAIDLGVTGVAEWCETLYHNLREILLHNKRLLWITRGATAASGSHINPGAASILGLLRSLRFEDSSLRPHTFDLPDADSEHTADSVANVLEAIAFNERYDQEYEFAEQDGNILIPRVVPDKEMSRATTHGSTAETKMVDFTAIDRCYQISTTTTSESSGHCVFEEVDSVQHLPGEEIEVQIVAQSLNRGRPIGTAAGIVLRIGAACTSIKSGDHVVTLQDVGIQSTVRCTSRSVRVISKDLSMANAAVLTQDYTIVYHALHRVVNLQSGEAILVADPASGYGQAAILLAMALGADVYVVVDDDNIRAFLVDVLSVPVHHILRFQDATSRNRICRWDVVFCGGNEEIPEYWRCMAEFGRLAVVGGDSSRKRSHSQLPHHASATFTGIDPELLRRRKPAVIAKALSGVLSLLHRGSFRLPETAKMLPYSRTKEAFELAANKGNMEPIVLTRQINDMVPVVMEDAHPLALKTEATYIIVGGLGGLGRSIAAFLVQHGAKHLVFLSRSGGQDDSSQAFLRSLLRIGATTAEALACDVANLSELQSALSSLTDLPTVRGILHAGMILRDCLFENMAHSDFKAALQPKIIGTWNLHHALQPYPLDFFVLLSSIAGIGGMRGQTNYAAGNSFQDAFAQYRRKLDLPATAIDLTVVLGVGVVAENPELIEGLKQAGVLSIQEEEVHRLIKAAITGYSVSEVRTPAQTIVGVATGGYLDRHDVQDSMWPEDHRFRYTLKIGRDGQLGTSGEDATVKLQIALPAAKTLSEAAGSVQEALVGKLAKAISVPSEDIDVGRCVSDYGVDSLIAVELRNWIQKQARASISVFDLMSTTPIRQLAEKIAKESSLVRTSLKGVAEA
jgi:acyl transferase domain-containing protein/NADPH:quinone reductase-like Zn-dependent oxidoreductase/NAD(P)-dependent dehydrogenase (short-subunit alcohol dehydrogenase family)